MALVRPLSDEDLAILAIESETVVGHTCKVVLLEEQIDAESLRDSITLRLDRAPELRFRLAEADGVLCWSEDGSIGVSEHVVEDRGGALDDEGLRRRVAERFQQRLDRSKPLWRLDVLPRLARGGSALVWRIHHALADGTTAMRIARRVLWDEPEADVSARAHPRASDGGGPPPKGGLLALAHETPAAALVAIPAPT